MSTGTALSQEIIRYYRDTERQYRTMWALDDAMALHYGYWGRGARNHVEALAHNNEELADRAQISAGDRVLDAGCGVGGSAVFLARTRGCSVVGINISPRQIELANNNAVRHGVAGKTEFRVQSYLETPFEDGSFDVVWFQESSCHAPDKQVLMNEAARVLRPGGRLIVADFFRSREGMTGADDRIMSLFEDSWAVPRFETIGRFESQIRAAGFEDVRAVDETEQIARSARRLGRLFYFGVTVKTIRRLWRPHNPAKMKNLWSCRYQDQGLRKGLWQYYVVSARKARQPDS